VSAPSLASKPERHSSIARSRGARIAAAALALLTLQAAAARRDAVREPYASALAPMTPAPTAQPTLWPADVQPQALYSDADAAAQKILAGMTLEEKVAQMIQADIASITPAQLKKYKLGSILAGGGAAPGNDARTTPAAWLDLTNAFFKASLETGTASHRAIPIIFGIDAVHGNAKIVGATVFPHNVALGAAHDAGLVRRIGAATAEEVSAVGVDWTFAPTVAVVRDSRWGRSYESYSEDPQLVAQYAGAMVQGLQGQPGSRDFLALPHTLASIKHFLGDGGTWDGRDQGDNEASEVVLAHVHGAGYPAGIEAGALIVMASYNSWHHVKMHASHYLLTDILKGRMGFGGFVVGDWNAHEQIPGCTKFDCPTAYLAGVDMLMAPDSWQALYEHTLAEAHSGQIPAARIDDAVGRILRVKVLSGMFERAPPLERAGAGRFESLGSAGHRALAREAVRKSLVLLKNEHGLLPLKPLAHVLVIGKAADDIGTQSGGWTIDWQGDHNLNADFPGGTSIYGGIAAAVRDAGGTAELSRYGEFSQRPDVAIVVYGESPYAEFQGDRETLEFSPGDKHDLLVLRRLRAARIPVVSVFLSGRPLWVNPELNASDAFVAAWLPGTEGAGVADVLFRGADGSIPYDFTGHLSFSWPAKAMPVHYDAVTDEPSGALFARGYGLNYAYARHVPELSELPQVAPDRGARNTLFQAAHVTAPWSIYLADASAEVRLTTRQQQSPGHGLLVTRSAAGVSASWDGSKPSVFRIAGRASDWRDRAADGMAVQLRYRLDEQPSEPVLIGILCTAPYERHPVAVRDPAQVAADTARCGTSQGALLDFTSTLGAGVVGRWRTSSYSLACFSARGADLGNVEAPFAIATGGRLALTIGDVRLVPQHGPPHCGGAS
jgi:beta-glucosidase